jgi:hypothetical protein
VHGREVVACKEHIKEGCRACRIVRMDERWQATRQRKVYEVKGGLTLVIVTQPKISRTRHWR